MESQKETPRTRHRPKTPAGELGLALGSLDYTAAAWDVPEGDPGVVWCGCGTVPHLPRMLWIDDEDSLITHDTVYDNLYDTDDNV